MEYDFNEILTLWALQAAGSGAKSCRELSPRLWTQVDKHCRKNAVLKKTE